MKAKLEPQIEPLFHPYSFGYRPGRSALDAVGQARRNCWDYDWVLDLDVRGFFDNLDWGLLMKAVKKHAQEPWVVLYIERWLKTPAQEEDGTLVERTSGTPQGGVISPLLANLFLHYAFDGWMARQFPHLPFERYADDAIVHCRTRREAEEVRSAVAQRLQECRLELHPEKTKIVYCKDEDRRGNDPSQKFDFLGYTFRPRKSKTRWGKLFVNFTPAISTSAAKAIRDEIRGWRLQSCSDKSIEDLSRMFNPIFEAGSTIMGDSIALPCICRYSNWTKRWRVGRHRNTRAFAVVNDVHINGSPGCPGVLRCCSLTGRW